MTTTRKNLRIQLTGELKEQWEELLDRKRISQQTAIEELIRTLIRMPDLAQSLLLGQIEPTDDLVAFALQQLGRGGPPLRLGAVIGGREPPSTTETEPSDRESTRKPSPEQAGGKAKDRR